MKFITAVIAAVAIGIFASMSSPQVSAADPKTKQAAPKTEVAYNYVAQPGDSYSLMARKATQTYGKNEKVSLTLGQILFVETSLTQEMGSPHLATGEKVTIKQANIEAWVKKAQKLTDEQKTAWQSYVQFVDFNTDNVGESRG